MAKVIAVCRSSKKGISKQPIAEGIFDKEHGLREDAHADCLTHRQVSLLARESIAKMNALGYELKEGAFAENITTEGISLATLPVGTRLGVGDEVVLEITQIGKECHTACAIRKMVGECIMPLEGVFARVIRGGRVRAEDVITSEQTGE